MAAIIIIQVKLPKRLVNNMKHGLKVVFNMRF